MYKRILLAYDGSQPGQKALLDCREIAQWSQASLTLIAVMPPQRQLVAPEGYIYEKSVIDQERTRYQGILNDGLRQLIEAGHEASGGEVVYGETVDEIARYARQIEADLIVVGHKHLDSWAARWWRGSVSKSLIEHAPCSVLVVITR
ncbi:Nucleotide-binding universal stress protein, UspA family [Polaromonas sp. YR568]|uniref:universal stress protein n=1 Tax=Polaromonas sp. YR568 TaxID=1855301 RepID=UPI0008E0751D|nr:universal stress protein [Polaromonas sp. YR568]SFU70183.1 Nucleotide-binding universal stress protein, UspA family [Polaromonas sp. YR568]